MTVEQQEDTAGEQDTPNRAAIGCLAVIGASFAGTIVIVVPETAYYTAGLLTAAGVRRARTWVAGRRRTVSDETDEAEQVDIVAVLQQLGEDGDHVLLTRLREAADLPDTKAVRTLLDEAGIPVRAGVRTPGGNGPGVHADDIPTPSPTTSDPSPGRCLCSSEAANANTNNRPDIVQDEHNPNRWHVVKEVAR